jgi:hypothetical protein
LQEQNKRLADYGVGGEFCPKQGFSCLRGHDYLRLLPGQLPVMQPLVLPIDILGTLGTAGMRAEAVEPNVVGRL